MNSRSALLSALLVAAPALAQDARELSTPTGHGYYYGTTAATLTNAINQGYRLTDIEIDSVSPLRFNAVLVQNSGVYQTGWWWYYGLDSAALANQLQVNNGRLIDLEAYDDGNGNTRFACIMVPNTGQQQKPWWYLYGVQPAAISTMLSSNNARLVDIDSYEINGQTRYVAVAIANTGADHRPFWWYYNVPMATITASVQGNGSRVYDLDRRPNGNFNAILIDEQVTPGWTYWYGLDAEGVSLRLGNQGHRLIDLECYEVNGQRRFAIVTINNSNALSTQISALMRATTDGTVGCYLRRVNGGELAGINERRVFEPASTMKTLHHVHAMRRVAMGLVSLNTNLNVFTAYSSPTSSCPIDSNPVVEDLATVLRAMMEQSDNARTQAVRAFFGQNAINATATALGMGDTELLHRIGCGSEAVLNPNEITLYDLGLLHEQVANGYLGSFRDEFYELMLNSTTWGGISSVVDQEAALLGLTAAAVTSFKARLELARKGGSYTLNGEQYRSGFGWIEIPFLQNGQVAPREYVVGAFVAKATDGTNASNAVSQAIGEMLRPTLRDALRTWDVVATSQSFGAGCGRMVHSAIGLPRIGQSMTMHADFANPSSIAVCAFGFSNQNQGPTPLPIDLRPAGFPGCFVLVALNATTTTVADASGDVNVGFSVPNSVNWLGFDFYTQMWSFGASLKASNGLHHVVGW